ncbi:MAG: Hsp20/alpha crystallin family protein [Chitinophagales bacterium]|jgi:HSP20 family protein|nr:Hsp20/alpha crystallin family protein [Sphingobacteriales bacterium]
MTLLKWQKDNKLAPSYSSLFNDWFDDNYFDKVAIGTSVPAVNIKDNDKDFSVTIAAPGLKKEDFKIALNHNILTISSEQKSEKEEKEEGKFTRKEYSYSSFSRSFTIPETVETDHIDAKYENGELKITLPKKEKATKVAKEITVS